MSRIEREMIAEARAAREAQRQRQEAADIGADIPSAPNDEQTQDFKWWDYAYGFRASVPPLRREGKDE